MSGTAARAATGAPRWLETWLACPLPAAPDQLPPAEFTTAGPAPAGCTLRQTLRVSVGGGSLRLRLSNAFGAAAVPVTGAAVALPRHGRTGQRAIRPGSSRAVSFGGRPRVRIPPGGQVDSDPVRLPVAARRALTVTVSLGTGLPAGGLTAHPGSRTTSYLLAGDRCQDTDLPGAYPIDHWYLLTGVLVPARPGLAAALLVGDSLTDGRGATTNRDDRWPDRLLARLHRRPGGDTVAVLNLAAGGTRLLDDGHGPGALERLLAEVASRPAVRWLVVFKGVNDLGTAAATAAAQAAVAADLVAGYHRVAAGARALGVRVVGVTLPPFGGHAGYDDPAGHRDRARERVNAWVRGSGRFDRVLDADRVVRDAAYPRRLAPGFDCGDHLHLSPAGYRALADAVPLAWFSPAGAGAGG